MKKQRYVCKNCNKIFLEENNWLKKYQRTTMRVLKMIFKKCASVSSFTSVAEDLEIPLTTLIRKFDLLQYPKSTLENLEVLSIDEFKGNTGREKYNCIIADAKNKIVLDILPNRHSNYIINHFFTISKQTRLNINFFVSDMWKPYKDLQNNLFKNSTFIVDKYHWIRQVIWAFEKVRKDEQKNFIKVIENF